MKKILVVGVLALGIVGSGLEASSDPEVSSARMVDWTGCEVSKLGADSELNPSQVHNYAPFQVRKATLIDPCDSKAFTTSAGVLKLSDFRGRLFNIHSM